MFESFIFVNRDCMCIGTGKTLVARALANECSSSDTKVAFFMRKGADCLSKWVGESERQLRLLFDQVGLCQLRMDGFIYNNVSDVVIKNDKSYQ